MKPGVLNPVKLVRLTSAGRHCHRPFEPGSGIKFWREDMQPGKPKSILGASLRPSGFQLTGMDFRNAKALPSYEVVFQVLQFEVIHI